MDSIANLIFVLTLLAALGSGLIAGAFFAFSSFVIGALSRIKADAGIAAMQSINIVVINPLFMLAFIGTALACLGLAVYSLFSLEETGSLLMLIGCGLYFVGTFLVTIIFNVPLNDELAGVDPESSGGAEVWKRYLSNWTMWNHVRTVAAIAASVSFILALVYRGA